MIGTIKSYCEAPKWAKLPAWLKHTCFPLGLDCEISVDSHWIRETVHFNISGEEIPLRKFKQLFDETMREYNRDLNE